MLARIANNLYWMGRYLKRAEQTARFIEVQHLASLDAPLTHKRKTALATMLAVTGSRYAYDQEHKSLTERDVLAFLTLDANNPASILTASTAARENARSARDLLPEQLYEAANRLYHYTQDFPPSKLRAEGVSDFLHTVEEYALVVTALANTMLVRDERWLFLMLGYHLEAAMQVCRIGAAKLTDIAAMPEDVRESSQENYQWSVMLKSIVSLDLHKKFVRFGQRKRMILDYVICNTDFPRSLSYNLARAHDLVLRLAKRTPSEREPLEYLTGSLAAKFHYLMIEDEPNPNTIKPLLDDCLTQCVEIGEAIERRYFGF